MRSDGRNYLGLTIYMSLFPRLAIMVSMLGFTFSATACAIRGNKKRCDAQLAACFAYRLDN
ncbi:ABC-type dipeptide/oligopeptide/nickel transport system permease subunit [Rhizobium sp. BK377]|nr:ABC-type dipeptide/oligopeptide/nickel transport system permease subunit [Rhizobium sp. BK377]